MIVSEAKLNDCPAQIDAGTPLTTILGGLRLLVTAMVAVLMQGGLTALFVTVSV